MSGVSQAAQTGQQNSSNSVPVVLSADQTPIPISLGSTVFSIAVTPAPSATGTVTTVSPSSVASTILVSNANRQLAAVYNANTQALYLITSSQTPSANLYTVQMAANGYYELPLRYTGQINGIWASSSGSGAALVTEYTS